MNCSIEGCMKPAKGFARDWPGKLCTMHRGRMYRKGDPNAPSNRHGRYGPRPRYENDPIAAAAWVRAKYTEARAALDSIKMESGCVDCGYRKHPAALTFDHLPGFEKCFNVSNGPHHSAGLVLTEIAKCEVVCANCHAIRTAARRVLP